MEAQSLNHCTIRDKQRRVQEIFRGTYEDFEAQWHELIPLQDFEAQWHELIPSGMSPGYTVRCAVGNITSENELEWLSRTPLETKVQRHFVFVVAVWWPSCV